METFLILWECKKHIARVALIVAMAASLGRYLALAKEPDLFFGSPNLTRAARSGARAIQLPKSWKWAGQPDYKQERLAYYQQLLRDRGINDMDVLRTLTANLIVENGSLSESVNGDAGCSVGIPQRNVCQFGYTAKSFLRTYPAWNDWRYQLEWMADHTVESYKKFDGDVFRTVVYHNRPAAAYLGVDSCHITPCYFKRVDKAAKDLVL